MEVSIDKCYPWGVCQCRRHKRRGFNPWAGKRCVTVSSACCPTALMNLESHEWHSGNAGPDGLREIGAGPGHSDQSPHPKHSVAWATQTL